MSIWRHLSRGLRALWNRDAADRDLTDEVESYLQHAAADLEAHGMSGAEARRLARLDAGSTLTVREEVRSSAWEDSVANWFSDLRYAARRLRGNPGFTVVSVLTLSLGIGATTAIFSVIDGVLLKPLPFPDSDRLISLRHAAPGVHLNDVGLSLALYFTYSEENRAFDGVGLWNVGTVTITGIGEPEEVPTLAVTHGFLPTLQVQAALGRRFTPGDDAPKAQSTVMISDGWWKSRFGGDRSVIGRRILIDGNAAEVIGVLPADFHFMDRKFAIVRPQRIDRGNVRLISFCCQGLARLKPGVTLQQATSDAQRMLPMAEKKFPLNPGSSPRGYADARFESNLHLLKDDLLGDIGNTLWVLMGTVGIVWLIACANVANLLLVRAQGRRQELAVRAALGAGWRRLARDILFESTLLGLVGGAFGVALAYGALKLLVAYGPDRVPRLQEIAIDPTVLVFAFVISLATGLLFGLISVIKYARPQTTIALGVGGRTVSQSKERHRARSVLIVSQIALALVLLVGSGLMIRTYQALHNVDPGFSRAGEVETFRVSIPGAQARQVDALIRMNEAIVRKIEAIPGVTTVGLVSNPPLAGGSSNPVAVQDRPDWDHSIPPIRRYKFVAPGYAHTIGARLVAGRDVTWAEIYSQAPVALISENMAREIWQHPDAALGKRIRSFLGGDWVNVIGVLGDLRDEGIDKKAPTIVYWPAWSKGNQLRTASLVVRSLRAGSTSLRKEIAQAVAAVNPNLPVADLQTLEFRYEQSMARSAFTLALLAIAAGMALLLGLVGIYGVISYSVSQRSREIGIRLALGAPPSQVKTMFVRHALLLAGIGAVCGLAAAFGLTRLMRSLLFEVDPADPLTYAVVAAGLIASALIASYLPARAATQIDPVHALRAE